jgi:hypothetical protein
MFERMEEFQEAPNELQGRYRFVCIVTFLLLFGEVSTSEKL